MIVALKALKDEGRGTRLSLIWALGEIKDSRAVRPLIASLKDAPTLCRWNSPQGSALEKIGKPAVGPLIAALKDEDNDFRSEVARVITKITGKDFGENLIKWQKWWKENRRDFLKGR